MYSIRFFQGIGWRLLVSVLVLLALAGVAWAQNGYTLGRFTAEHSGAVATGNGYTLVGATGQSDTGGMQGGGFVLAGGFLVGAPPEIEEPAQEMYLPRVGR
jgi:hypothetical protein